MNEPHTELCAGATANSSASACACCEGRLYAQHLQLSAVLGGAAFEAAALRCGVDIRRLTRARREAIDAEMAHRWALWPAPTDEQASGWLSELLAQRTH